MEQRNHAIIQGCNCWHGVSGGASGDGIYVQIAQPLLSSRMQSHRVHPECRGRQVSDVSATHRASVLPRPFPVSSFGGSDVGGSCWRRVFLSGACIFSRIVKPREQGSGGQDKILADQVSDPACRGTNNRQPTTLSDVTSGQRELGHVWLSADKPFWGESTTIEG